MINKISLMKNSIIFATIALFIFPLSVQAQGLTVVFETGTPPTPLFDQANFLPGDIVARWADVTNTTPDPQTIGLAVTNFVDPDDLADQIDMVIASNATEIFSGTLQELFDLGELELTASLADSATARYDFSATFNPNTGNPYQNATVGFDLVFGILVADLDIDGAPTLQSGSSSSPSSASGGSGSSTGGISGIKFYDANANGTFDLGEEKLAGWIVYLDTNNNQTLEVGEQNMLTDPFGTYLFTNLAPGAYAVRTILQDGWSYMAPNATASNQHVVVVAGGVVDNNDFGVIRGQVAGISDAVSLDQTPTTSSGQVLAAVDELPRTGTSLPLLFAILGIFGGVSSKILGWKRV